MLQDSELKTDFWMTDIEKQLCQYVRYEKLIPRLQEKLIELKGTLQIVTGPEWTAYQDEIHQMLAHTIDLQILYVEECLQRYLKFRRQLESAIKVEFEEPRYEKFIILYWGSGHPKSKARDLVMQELNLSQTTFYRWRKTIMSKIALRLKTREASPHL